MFSLFNCINKEKKSLNSNVSLKETLRKNDMELKFIFWIFIFIMLIIFAVEYTSYGVL